MWGSNHSLLRSSELQVLPVWVTTPRVGFMVRLCISFSYLFWCGIFLICSMWRSHSASFWISFRGNCPVCIAVDSVSMGRGEFRRLLHCPLELERLSLELLSNLLSCTSVFAYRLAQCAGFLYSSHHFSPPELLGAGENWRRTQLDFQVLVLLVVWRV